MSFFGELRRRNVVKVAVAYAIVGWLLIEVSSTVFPLLQLPEWTATFVAVLLLMGFPIALILSWAYELTPEGMKKSHEVEAAESITQTTGQKLNYAIIGALVLALGFMVYNYVLVGADQDAVVQETATLTVEPASENSVPVVEEEQPEALPNSVAVLLCDNLSPNPDDAYFAAGIHEEILNQLVKLRNLSVIARTSVLQYADAPPPIPQIAAELNVETVMECSVRYAGDAILVTAQLIDPETDLHLWSDTYPGNMSDLSTVFAMQADIAMNIANAVGAEFSLEEQASLESVPTESPEAYRFYLAALEYPPTTSLRGELLSRAIEADPNFALAYASRAGWYVAGLNRFLGAPGGADLVAQREERALDDLSVAFDLDPDLGFAYAVAGFIADHNWRGVEARDAYEEAYRLSPNDVFLLQRYAIFNADAGEYADALRLEQRARELDPGRGFAGLAIIHEYAKRLDLAADLFNQQLVLNPGTTTARVHLAAVEKVRGNYAAAASALRGLSFANTVPVILAQAAYVFALIESTDEAESFVAEFERRAIENRQPAGAWVLVSLAKGDEERALDWLRIAAEQAPYEGYTTIHRIKANVWEDPVLNRPEFVELRERLGYTDL